MLRLLVCASLLVPAAALATDQAAPTAATAAEAPKPAKKAKPRTVCHKIRVTGSRLPVKQCEVVKEKADDSAAATTGHEGHGAGHDH